MKNKGNKWMSLIVLALMVALLAFPVGASAAKVRLNKTKITVMRGKSCKLKLTGTKKSISWKSSKGSVATVNSKGKVTGKKKGTAVITARCGGKNYKCKVTVKQPVTSVSVSKSKVTLLQGKSCTLKATAKPSGASNRKVKWSSSNTAVVTVSSKGKVTAVGAGTATVTATAADGSKKKDSCKVTVTPRMTISQSSLTLEKGGVAALSVSQTGGSSVVWGSSNPGVATVSGGSVIAVSAGTTVIVVQKTDGSQSATCTVTVTDTAEIKTTTAEGKRFLSILERYSNQVRTDKAAGKLWGYSNSSKLNPKTWTAAQEALNTRGITYNNCALLVRIAMREMGILGENQNFWGTPEGGIHFNSGVAATLRQHCQIISVYQTPNELLAEGRLLPGDICTWTFDYNHTNVYAGNGLWYDAGRGGDGSYVKKTSIIEQFGHDSDNLVSDGSDKTSMYIFNSFGPCSTINMNTAVIGQIIRIVK